MSNPDKVHDQGAANGPFPIPSAFVDAYFVNSWPEVTKVQFAEVLGEEKRCVFSAALPSSLAIDMAKAILKLHGYDVTSLVKLDSEHADQSK